VIAKMILHFLMEHWREALGFVIGLAYLWWEYQADSKVWIASVIMPMISMWIYFSKGLYADFGINIYYLVIAVYGYICWTRGTSSKKKESRRISHTPIGIVAGCAAATLVLWYGIWLILTNFTNSTVPVTDAFTTALSIVALWMMARKYAEQWLAWLVVDLISAGLYVYKGIPFYGVLYTIYTVIAWFGYRKWLRLMAKDRADCAESTI
jgi:nicotinamide mononucleotide transporter